MKRSVQRHALAFVAALTLQLLVVAGDTRRVAAQEWPNSAVKIIVVGGAGGGGDILARLVAERLSSVFKQNFVVENRVGAGGTIGSQAISSAAPDGYTLGAPLLSSLSLASAINPSVQYDPSRGFTHIAYIAGAPVVLTSSLKTNVKTLPEFVRYAQANRFTYATAGVGTDGHLAGELIAENLKLASDHVSYKSAAQGMSDIVAGHVSFATFNFGSSTAFLRSSQVNGVAVTSRQRLPDYPNLPTFSELGYPNVVMTTWYLLSGPPNLPADIVDKLNREVRKFVATPEMQQRFRRDGLVSEDMSPAELKAYVASENTRWKPLIESVRARLK